MGSARKWMRMEHRAIVRHVLRTYLARVYVSTPSAALQPDLAAERAGGDRDTGRSLIALIVRLTVCVLR